MEIELSFQDKKRIEQSIRQKYNKVATSPEGLFQYPTGLAGLKALYYDPELIQALPDTVAASYCGVGNPFTLGPIREGEAVLDIGCGAGVDTILAGEMVGPSGKAVGVDVVPEMLERAIENLNGTSLTNVTFREASAQDLPFADETFDVVISNGVFNLVPDKLRALAEAFRVLKPNGRLTIADQLLTGDLPDDMKPRIESWFR
jgi:SAM-dependent methyltransferase